MRIQFASQFFNASSRMGFGSLIKPVAPTLMLLGNAVNPWTIGGRHFLRAAATEFDSVLLVPGPAEYASNRNECWRMNMRRLLDETTLYKNVEVLCQNTHDVPAVKTVIAGATLWGPLTGFLPLAHPDTAWVRERMLVTMKDGDEDSEALLLRTIHEDAVRNLCRSDRNFLNDLLLAPKRPERFVFGTYYLPQYECMSNADATSRENMGMLNDYRFMFRKPLKLWLCGAGIGGRNHWDRDTGILFAKNARGDEDEAAAGYSPAMFMDVGAVSTDMAIRSVGVVEGSASLIAGTRLLDEVAATAAANTDVPPAPAPDVDFYPEGEDWPHTP